MRRLSPVDQLFLWLERRQQPVHVAGLQLFSYPEGAKPSYVRELAESMSEYTQPSPPFNQRLVNRWGQTFWDADQQFDLACHFRHEALPKPGRIRELLSLVSAEHSNLLDRQRPLWEAHLIEGLRGRRFALYTKVHHSLVDGIAAMRLGMRALSTDPEERNLPPVWAQPPRKRKSSNLANPVDLAGSVAQLTSTAGKQVATVPTVAREVYRATRKARHDPDYVSVFQAPQSMLNQGITGSRRFAAQSYSMERIRAVGQRADCTVNDVVLAMCGSALREYLIGQNALPDAPLIAMVPVSLRQDESDDGNQVATILANLGTHIADPGRRLEVIRASVREGKNRYQQMNSEEILNYTALTLAPTCLNLMTGMVPRWQAFNVVISNVPGPKEPLYWNGARLEGMYPVSIVLDRLALNITLTSYIDQIEFGLIACRRTLPSMQRLLDYLERSLFELEVAVDIR